MNVPINIWLEVAHLNLDAIELPLMLHVNSITIVHPMQHVSMVIVNAIQDIRSMASIVLVSELEM